jgi:ABC-type branched-subunit amino acid transport system substrate-binding protein
LGAFRSAVSSPSSIVTGLYGYPQISGASTSAALDDEDQYPKFARTIPSDDGVTEAIIEYFHETLGLDHLVVMNINDSFGNSYVRGLKNAATKLAPNMTIVQIPIDETADDESIRGAIASIKASKYNHILCIVLSSAHDSIMMEASRSRMGVAGDGKHNWLFSDLFSGVLNDREFEKGSTLQLAYRGTGMLR